MGTLLKVSNADFSTNGIPLCPPAPITEENLIPLFQNNAAPVGTIVIIGSSSDDGTSTADNQGNTAFGVTRTSITKSFTFIKFKPKSGYSVTIRGYKQESTFPNQIYSYGGRRVGLYGGSPVANTEETVISLDGYNEFAFNVKQTDGVTTLQDNDLSNYFEYIKAEGIYTDPLEKLKAVMESKIFYAKRWGSSTIYNDPNTDGNTRSACGVFSSDMIDGVAFKVTPKSGCKIVPIQCSSSAGRWSFSWQTTAQVFDNFNTYPVFGVQVAYSNDAAIPTTASLWDFIDVELETG